MAVQATVLFALRVAVVNRDAKTRLYFRAVLESASGFELAGGFSNAAEALKGIPPLQPQLVLMGIRLPDLNGIECTKQLKRTLPHLGIVIVTEIRDEDSVKHSSRAGADAYLIRPVTAEQCLATLRFAAASKTKPNQGKPTRHRSSVPPLEAGLP